MRVFTFAALVLAVATTAAVAQTAQQWPREFPPRPLAARPMVFLPFEVKTLPNGLTVVVVSQNEQPAISMRMIVRAGSAQDPKGKLGLAMPLDRFIPEQLAANGFSLLNIDFRHAARVESLPFLHRDPFDRLLVAQAQAEKLTLVSADARLSDYGVKRIW